MLKSSSGDALPVTFDQEEFDLRCEWGIEGARRLAPISDVIVIVDVLSFSTAVDIATANGATVLPYRWKDDSARRYAESRNAHLAASARTASGAYSLSPASLETIPPGFRLVLPSPNGVAIAMEAGARSVYTACLRNAAAVAAAAGHLGGAVAIIPAGEQWESGALRPSVEDFLGAGAVLANLPGRLSPEAELAVRAFESLRGNVPRILSRCSSGKELIERGFARDVDLASELNTSACVPRLIDMEFVNRP